MPTVKEFEHMHDLERLKTVMMFEEGYFDEIRVKEWPRLKITLLQGDDHTWALDLYVDDKHWFGASGRFNTEGVWDDAFGWFLRLAFEMGIRHNGYYKDVMSKRFGEDRIPGTPFRFPKKPPTDNQ